MAIVLGGTVLSEHLTWTDEHKHSIVKQSIARTLGGSLVVQNTPVLAGRPITLVATADQGWITKAMLDSITAMSEVLGAVYQLTTHNGVFSVVFDHTSQPAVTATPLLTKQVYLASDYYAVTIKLMTV